MPLGVELIWKPLNPDIKRYTKALQANMTRLWKAALKEFITVIIRDQQVHVDTGMSMASLYDVAIKSRMWTKLKGAIIARQKHSRRIGVTNIDGSYDKSRYREIKEGQAIAEAATSIKFDLPVMEFSFDIQVFQWWYWEIKRGAWNSLEPASQAFIDFIDRNWQDYVPGLEELLDLKG